MSANTAYVIEGKLSISNRTSGEGLDKVWRGHIGGSTSRIPHTYVKVFLPRRYGCLFTDDNLSAINEKTVSLYLKYIGTNTANNSYILEIE